MKERLITVGLLGGLLLFNAWLIAEMACIALSDAVKAARGQR